MRWLDALAKKARPGDDTTVADRMAEAYEASRRGDYARALEIWGPLAHAGVARAQNNVGACFTEGLGVERDPKLAAQWLALAAAAGDAVAQRNCAAARRLASQSPARWPATSISGIASAIIDGGGR